MQIYRKDARLPVQLQRAMAAEAEAAREARAKVSWDFYYVHTVYLCCCCICCCYIRSDR